MKRRRMDQSSSVAAIREMQSHLKGMWHQKKFNIFQSHKELGFGLFATLTYSATVIKHIIIKSIALLFTSDYPVVAAVILHLVG